MDKVVVFAVAGSGKSKLIIDQLDATRRALLLTYTENNYDELRRRVIRRFGCVPENIYLDTYFSFLNAFCYRPYLLDSMNSRGINFRPPPAHTSRLPLSSDLRFVDGERRVYHARMAKLVDVKGCMPLVRRRLERYFDVLYVDEVQDFAGHDFNLLMALCRASVDVLLVGDFYQHTYDTSRDGSVNKNLHASYGTYLERLKREELRIDTTSLRRSYRCSEAVCEFIRTNMGIEMYSASERVAKVIWIDDVVDAKKVHGCNKTVKLFYQEHHRYGCNSQNWGGCKGLDHYEDVCVVLNQKAAAELHAGRFALLNPTTRNKLYVACSRARGDLYLVPEKLLRSFRGATT